MTLGETKYVALGTEVCAGSCDHPACGVPFDVLVARAYADYFRTPAARKRMKDEFAMLGDLIRNGDADALAEYMSPDLDEEAAQAAARRTKRPGL